MASTPLDAFASNPRSFPSFDTKFLNASSDNFWNSNGGIIATATTGNSEWEAVLNLEPEKKADEVKKIFHSGRQLLVKHLPRDTTEEDIRDVVTNAGYTISSLQFQIGSGLARVNLEDPELLEDLDTQQPLTIRGQRVSLSPSPTEMMLCVARLPPKMVQDRFTALVGSCGEVRRCFLMITEKTGECKGYGFVEYATKEAALQAKNWLDGKSVGDTVLVCDWLDSSHTTLKSLHSKCLYVDKLPKDYRNMGEFRKIFSFSVNPPYCQIALKNGCPQDWGLVEFLTPEDAEATVQELDGHELRGQKIRVSYYIPGVRAINLYLKLLTDNGSKGKTALLPDPPAPAVFQQLQNLAKQNPIFAQNLQSIILSHIQSLQASIQGGNGMVTDQSSPPNPNSRPSSTVPPTSTAHHINGNAVNGMNGTARVRLPTTNGTMNNGVPPPPPLPQPHIPTSVMNGMTTGANGSTNAQAALVILLAAQMQAGTAHPSLLGNPQMLSTLQTLVKQGQQEAQGPNHTNISQLLGLQGESLRPQFPPQFNQLQMGGGKEVPRPPGPPPPLPRMNGYKNGGFDSRSNGHPTKVPLLPKPQNEITNGRGENESALTHPSPTPSPLPQEQLVLWMNLLQQLQPHQDVFTPPSNNGKVSPLYAGQDLEHMLHPTMLMPEIPQPMPPPMAFGIHHPPPPPMHPSMQAHNPLVAMLLQAAATNQQLSEEEANKALWGSPRREQMGSPVFTGKNLVVGGLQTTPSTKPSVLDTTIAPPPHMAFAPHGWHGLSPLLFPPSTSSALNSPYINPALIQGVWGQPIMGSMIHQLPPPPPFSMGLNTPLGQKRKMNHILPSPEPSPEGDYIGQHSQGLGGHYADSYFKKKKKS